MIGGKVMKNKFIFISDILLGVVVAMLCIECILISGSLKHMEQQIGELKTQIASLTDANAEIKYNIDKVASDTDAQIQSINEKLDEQQTNYEKLNKEIQKSTEEPKEVSKEVNEVVTTYVAEIDETPVKEEDSAPTPDPVVEEQPEVVEQPQNTGDTSGMTYMGNWCISAYEWSDQACANGNMPTVWYTCAFNEAPLGATIYIDGLGYFVNEDICGTPGRLDIFLGDVDTCIQFGTQYYDVYIVN
jgi:prefoldin subunit 5